MGAAMLHSTQAAPTQSDNLARSPTSLTPIARVAYGDRRSKHKGKGALWNPLAPIPRLVPGCGGYFGLGMGIGNRSGSGRV